MKHCILHCAAVLAACFWTPGIAAAADAEVFNEGYWTTERANEILSRTRRVHVQADLSALRPGERAAVPKLLSAGRLLHEIYEDSLHPEAIDAIRRLSGATGDDARKRALVDLYYMFRGPIATTLENKREPFLPVAPQEPGRNVYPWAITTTEVDGLLTTRPDLKPGLLAGRSVVRANTPENLATDLDTLDRYPMIDGLHPGLRERLTGLAEGTDKTPLYALPYSVRWAPRIYTVYELLIAAAADVRHEDPDFAAYLRLRARDLVTDDYEGGDAAWVTGRFGHLNAQIGSYETYDDDLYGVKSFFSLSLLVRDDEKSRELQTAVRDIQALQDSLPQAMKREVRTHIPVGVYNVIADFGQARGTNTATILPNDADHGRKYGRTILLRYNIMMDPGLFEDSRAAYAAAVLPEFADDLTIEGKFYRTLWHEIGHYLGVDKTSAGVTLGEALAPWSDLIEEMKSDLLSLFAVRYLNQRGLMDDRTLRSIYAAGVQRTLQKVKPRREQPYQTMQLMQMNYFLAHGLLEFDSGAGRLAIDHERYPQVVEKLLGDLLSLQEAGDASAVTRFMDQYSAWDEALHERLAIRLRAATPYRYRMARYETLAPNGD